MGRKKTTKNPYDQRKQPKKYHTWYWKHVNKPRLKKKKRQKRRRKRK